MPRPSSAIFTDGKTKPLAILPKSIGVSYDTRDTLNVAEVDGGVAVLCIDGPLSHHAGWWANYEDLAADFKALCDDGEVRSIVLKFDSPGGECAGLNETIAILQGMKTASGKTVIGYVDESCYSAAYALAMVCDEIFMPASAGVGSIGVITAMADCTEADKKQGYRVEVIASGDEKTDGHPHVALTDAAIGRTKRVVDSLAEAFFAIVSSSRGISVDAIRAFQAGTFTGYEAVDAGLVDGIMSLDSVLTLAKQCIRTSRATISRSGEKAPMAFGTLAAQKALNDANKALASAKTDAERALAAARVLAAESAAASLTSKVKKTKTVTTDTHEEEVDDGEEDDEEDSSVGAEDDEDAEEDGDDAEALHSDSAKTGLHTKDRLLRLARQITGKQSIEEVMGALHATWQGSKKSSKLAAEVATLRADVERGKVAELVRMGTRAGKLAPSQIGWAKSQTPAALKAYLDAAPKMVATIADESVEARVETTGFGSVTPEMSKIWRKQGFHEKDFAALLAKMNVNKTNGAS